VNSSAHNQVPAPLSEDQMKLEAIGRRLAQACPDMRQMAREAAREILSKHIGQEVEPDGVYWHRFSTAVSSSRSFNGWQHFEAPIETMTLPQLAMYRFNAHDQDNADSLQMMSGFYSVGPQAKSYNESNEVRMLPIDVMEDLWAIDLSARYHTRLDSFWRDCFDDFRTLTKASFIAKAVEDSESGHLSAEDLQTVINAVAGNISQPIQLSTLTSLSTPPSGVRVTTFDIAGYEASDMLRIVAPNGRQVIFIPGETVGFHAFETPEQLHAWVVAETEKPDDRARFMAHFPLSTHQQNGSDVGLNHMMDLLRSTLAVSDHRLINQKNQAINTDVFACMRDAAKARMLADASLSLRSNTDLRKQMWIGYFNAAAHIFGPLGAIDWPIALALVGAGLANMGLNIDQAVNGHTTAERQQAVIAAIFDAIDVLFNSLSIAAGRVAMPVDEPLIETATEHPPASNQNTAASITTAPITTTPAISPESQLIDFETNALLDGFAPSQQAGQMYGISLTSNGDRYISLNGSAYQVRYVNEMKSWVIIDPRNPFSFYRNLPVRLNNANQWEIVTGNGLKGGGPVASRMQQIRRRGMALRARNSFSDYDVPESMKPQLVNAANGNDRAVLRGDWADLSDPWHDPYIEFRALRDRLASDAAEFFKTAQLPTRPEMPALNAAAPCKATLKALFSRTQGLVTGESHAAIGSKQFLIENMPLLGKLKVRTLYMEHLLTDFHQTDLDEFASTGHMSDKLENYLKGLDTGHNTDPGGQYTFLGLVRAANRNNVRIQAIDCMASYRLEGMDNSSGTLRQKMMNYFARGVIQADAPARGADSKWIALVGNSHANTYKDVPGLSELNGAIGLRVEDALPGQANGFSIDTGARLSGKIGEASGFVKSDFKLQMAVLTLRPAESVESRLVCAGMFIIDNRASPPVLIHRSSDNSILRTVIKHNRGKVYIERPRWPAISDRRFDSVGDLAAALKLMGMKDVG